MKDSRFSKILTEGAHSAQKTDSESSPARPAGVPRPDGDGKKWDAEGVGTARTSLYEDTLSRKAESPWRAVALVVVVLILGGALIAFFAGGSSETKPLIDLGEAAPNDSAAAQSAALTPSTTPEPSSPQVAAGPKAVPESDPAPAARPAVETPQAPDAAAVETARREPPPAQTRQAVAVVSKPPSSQSEAPAPRPEAVKTDTATEQPPPAQTRETSPPSSRSENGRRRLELPARSEKPSQPETPAASAAAPVTPATAGDEEAAAPTAPARGAEDYQKLLSGSPVAAKLVAGGFSTISYLDWRVVQQTDTETWIDLIGRWNSSGDEVHFIWSVSRDSGNVRALSEAARNLERSTA